MKKRYDLTLAVRNREDVRFAASMGSLIGSAMGVAFWGPPSGSMFLCVALGFACGGYAGHALGNFAHNRNLGGWILSNRRKIVLACGFVSLLFFTPRFPETYRVLLGN